MRARFLAIAFLFLLPPLARAQNFETAYTFLLFAEYRAGESFPKCGNAVQDLTNGLTELQDLVVGYAIRGALPGKDAEVKKAIADAKALLDLADTNSAASASFIKDAKSELDMAHMSFQMFMYEQTMKYSAWCADSCTWSDFYADLTTSGVKKAKPIISDASKLLVPQ